MDKKSASLDFGWNAASSLLTKVYRRFYKKNLSELDNDIRTLFDHIKEYGEFKSLEVTGTDVEIAVKNYIFNDDPVGGSEGGTFFPDISAIVKELKYVIIQRKKVQGEEINNKRISFDENKTMVTIPLKGTPVEKWFSGDSIEVMGSAGSKCNECFDAGTIRFYYIKGHAYHVFTAKEWIDLCDKDEAKAFLFTCALCYCDHCSLGRLIYSRFQQNTIKPPRYSTILKLVEHRKEKKKERDVAKEIEDGGEQGDLLRSLKEEGVAVDPETRLVAKESTRL
jgi:hypothetical protein